MQDRGNNNVSFRFIHLTPCQDGFTVILVERCEGVSTKPIKTSYSSTAGTAFITFDNVKVPVENTLGEENDGLRVILSNFNHERWVMCCASARSQRLVVEECITWANQRQARPLPVDVAKLSLTVDKSS